MKLQVTKTGAAGRKVVRGKGFSIEVTSKSEDIEIPARGFIEAKDIKLKLFTNSKKQIVKIEVTLGEGKAAKLHVFKDDHPFILWSEAEQQIEFYLQSLQPKQETQDPLAGLAKKRITKKK